MTQGVASVSISLSFMTFMMLPIMGSSNDHWDSSCKIGQVWDNEGYLILIVALNSIYLNPYDDVAIRSSECPSQACTDNLSAYEV